MVAFPASNPEWQLPEGSRHSLLCELLAHLLRQAAGLGNSVGADQFVYFDASDARRCLAPDAFLKRGVPFDLFESWKTWERGVPELCVEILSASDTQERLAFREKLERYEALGTRELVVFDFDAAAGRRLRAWDRLDDQWAERVVEDDTTPCLTLGLHFVIAPAEYLPEALRLAHEASGASLILTRAESETARAEAAVARAEAAERELAQLRR